MSINIRKARRRQRSTRRLSRKATCADHKCRDSAATCGSPCAESSKRATPKELKRSSEPIRSMIRAFGWWRHQPDRVHPYGNHLSDDGLALLEDTPGNTLQVAPGSRLLLLSHSMSIPATPQLTHHKTLATLPAVRADHAAVSVGSALSAGFPCPQGRRASCPCRPLPCGKLVRCRVLQRAQRFWIRSSHSAGSSVQHLCFVLPSAILMRLT